MLALIWPQCSFQQLHPSFALMTVTAPSAMRLSLMLSSIAACRESCSTHNAMSASTCVLYAKVIWTPLMSKEMATFQQ